ncbi:MAG: hypothetical protein HY769_07985 [Candidatus Stahlbacteria bacterium]|nr:hypothetical protein [Candidatus Stahlbacteria bacterium]
MLYILLSLIFAECDKCPPGIIKVAVFEFSSIGTKKELSTTISDLLRIELTNCTKYEVMDKSKMISIMGEDLVVTDMGQAIGYSESLSVSYAVIGNINKLGNKVIISVSVINRWTKSRVFSDKLTSANVDDIETVIKRLATTVCEFKKSGKHVTVETVTAEEARPKLRRTSYGTAGLLLGYIFPFVGSFGKEVEGDEGYYYYTNNELSLKGNVTQMPGGGISYLYETPSYMMEASYRLHQRTQNFYTGIEFAGYKFLSLEDFSPFVGGGLGMGWGSKIVGIDTNYHSWERWDYEGDSSYTVYDTSYSYNKKGYDGLSISLGGGVVFFRTYDFHFFVSGNYIFLLAPGTPNGLMITFGLTYKMGGCGF